MNFIGAIICVGLCLKTGSADNLGPIVKNVLLGYIDSNVSPLTSDDLKATKKLKGLLQDFRSTMRRGMGDTLPPTDPYVAESLPSVVFDNPQSIIQGEMIISKLIALGGSRFVINNLQVRVDSGRVDFDISVPSVDADIYYHTDEPLLYDDSELNLSGQKRISLENLSASGTLCFEQEYTDSDATNLIVIGLKVKNSVTNIKIDADTSDASENIINDVIDAVSKCLAEKAMTDLNSFLNNFTIEEILDHILR